jgi:hypothetical protein
VHMIFDLLPYELGGARPAQVRVESE